MLGYLKRFLKRRNAKANSNSVSLAAPSKDQGATTKPSNGIKAPEWKGVLTDSLVRNCVAPSDEAILHAFDLYCRDLYAPFYARQQEMADLFSEVNAAFADLQGIIPDVIERAMARDPFEFSHVIEHNPES